MTFTSILILILRFDLLFLLVLKEVKISILVQDALLVNLRRFRNEVIARSQSQFNVIKIRLVLGNCLFELMHWLDLVFLQGVDGEALHVVLDKRHPLEAHRVSVEFIDFFGRHAFHHFVNVFILEGPVSFDEITEQVHEVVACLLNFLQLQHH